MRSALFYYKLPVADYYFQSSILIMGGAITLVVGFSIAADSGFNTPRSYGIIIASIVLILLSFINFSYTSRIPVIPPVSRDGLDPDHYHCCLC